MKIVLVTGMQGAGKSELALAFKDAGVPVIVMGDVVREESRRRGLEPNSANNKKVMLELREKDGMGAIALRCVDDLKSMKSDLVVIEGCRSIDELDVFDDYAKEVKIICVHTSPSVRFQRLRERGRKDAPQDWSTFRERDLREVSVGLGGIISLSDIMLVNEGSLEDFRKNIKSTVAEFI
ncbi:MAG: AAA family ATPase [Candidatus Thorarchaeota archaeon]|jgi:dephospho-CoA kinase